jgi:hypothetical protein
MHTKKLNKLVVIRDRDILGLNDSIFNGKNAFTIELISSKGEIFRIKRQVVLFNIAIHANYL